VNSLAGVRTAGLVWLATGPAVCARPDGFDVKSFAAGFMVAGTTSYFADFDHERSTAGRAAGAGVSKAIARLCGGHRMGMHSLLLVSLAFLATCWATSTLGPAWAALTASWSITAFWSSLAWSAAFNVAHPIAFAVATGWLAHIFCDTLTVMGAGLLWPLTRRRFRIGNLTTGGQAEDHYVTLITCAALVVAAWHLNTLWNVYAGGSA
jgi:membrane-bound metal-dependent hydrolase YbcI (DUF457 family)